MWALGISMLVFAGVTLSILAFQPTQIRDPSVERSEGLAAAAALGLNAFHQAAVDFAQDPNQTVAPGTAITLADLLTDSDPARGGIQPYLSQSLVTAPDGTLLNQTQIHAERPLLALWEARLSNEGSLFTYFAPDFAGPAITNGLIQPYNVRLTSVGYELGQQTEQALGTGIYDGAVVDAGQSGSFDLSADLTAAMGAANVPTDSPVRVTRIEQTAIDIVPTGAAGIGMADLNNRRPDPAIDLLMEMVPPPPACRRLGTAGIEDCCVDWPSASQLPHPDYLPTDLDTCLSAEQWVQAWEAHNDRFN